MSKQCTKCKVEKSFNDFSYNKGPNGKYYYRSYCKKCSITQADTWQKNNPQKHKENYNRNNHTERHKENYLNLKKSIPAGVYEILYKGKRVYVGQSKKPYNRITIHFSKFKDLDSIESPVSYKLSTGEIKRKDLSYSMLEYIDDKDTRETVEQQYITKSTGLWNVYYKVK